MGANVPAGDSHTAAWFRSAASIWALCIRMKPPASKPQDMSPSKIWSLKEEACNVLPGVVPQTEPLRTWL